MSKLEYFIYNSEDLGHNIEGEFLSLERPKWFTTQPLIENQKSKSISEYIKKYWDDLMDIVPATIKTSKACPAFNTLFKHSVVIKFPCDVLFETRKNGEYKFQTKNKHTILKTISHHSTNQFKNMPGNYVAIKFEFNAYIHVKNTLVQYIDPLYWADVPYKVSPGLVQCEYLPLNVIAFFPIKDEKYHFEAGSVLTAMTFSNPITKIESADLSARVNRREWQTNKHFLRLGKYNDQ